MSWDDPRSQIRPLSSYRKPLGNVFSALIRMQHAWLMLSMAPDVPAVFRRRRGGM